VSEFVGAIPAAAVERFMDELVPSEADELARAGDEASLRRALQLDPRHREAATALGRILIERGELDEALRLLENVAGDFEAEGLAARAKLLVSGAADDLSELGEGLEALAGGDVQAGLERLDGALRTASDETRDLIRRVMVGVFSELGADHPLSRDFRRRLATALY
jgi:putative thioredoxin